MDASGKTPSGILAGNTFSLGNFDQCLGIRHEITSNNEFNGQYCLMDVRVDISKIIYSRNVRWEAHSIDINSVESEEIASVTQRKLPRYAIRHYEGAFNGYFVSVLPHRIF